MPQINYYSFIQSLQRKIATKKRIPLCGQWEFTFSCNLRCLHCDCVRETHQAELTYQEITDILDQIQAEGCLWLCFTGGEPLIRGDFLDIYTYAKRKGFLITLFTNGTLITKEIADYLKRYPPFLIEITLNGITKSTYETITQTKDSFQRVMKGIALILERNLPLTIKSNGMTINRDEILKIKEWVKGLGDVRFRYDSVIMPRRDGSREPVKLRLSPQEIIEVLNSDEDMRKQLRKCVKAKYYLNELNGFNRCEAGISSFCINPYGQLQFCPSLQNPFFDLRQGSFREGFYDFFLETRLIKFPNDSKCRDCSIWYLCPRCPGQAQIQEDLDYFCQLAHTYKEITEMQETKT